MKVVFATIFVLAMTLVSRADYIYDFSGVTGGNINLVGQDGWTNAPGFVNWLMARGTTGVDVHASSMSIGTPSGTGAGYRISNGDAAWPFTGSVDSFSLIFETTNGSSRIARTGLGNASGVPFFVIGGNLASWSFTPASGTAITGGTIGSGYQNFDAKLDVNLVAGTASFSVGTQNTGVFSPVTGMQNMSLNLPNGFVASDFKSLYVTIRDQGQIDDITIAAVAVPEPATMALLGIAGLCLLPLVRRRGS